MPFPQISRGLLLAAALCGGSAMAQIDINQASEAELDSIRGVGPATTRRILQERAVRPFQDWGDFMARVRGIGRASAAKFSAQGYTVAGAPYTAGHPLPRAQTAASGVP